MAETPDVDIIGIHWKARLILEELELVRLEIGGAASEPPPVTFSNVRLHEIQFAALVTLKKADRLCFEYSRRRFDDSVYDQPEIGLDRIGTTIDLVLDRLQRVKVELGITDEAAASRLPVGQIEYSEILNLLGTGNRKINMLLAKPFAPADVFQEVTQAVAHAAGVLAAYPGFERIGADPTFERRKRPADVYNRLLECFKELEFISAEANIPMVRIHVTGGKIDTVEPGDVYDIAALIASELALLKSRTGGDGKVIRTVYPGRKLPSHVYQRVGILQQQLSRIRSASRRNPGRIQ